MSVPEAGEGPAGASLANWRSSPWNRWSFRNIPEILPVAEIAAGAPRTLIDAHSAVFDDFQLDRPGGVTLDLAGFLAATATDGLVVLRDGWVLLEAYANGTERDTRHILMSATKAMTGLIAGALVGAGRLDVEAPVAEYVPEVEFSGWQDATVRNLLDMRTGVIPDLETTHAYTAAANWDPFTPDEAEANLHDFLTTLPPAAAPHGGPFRYVSANTDLLGWVLERAGGRPFAELASDLFWKPAGAERAALITLDRAGAPRCTGGLCATVRDFARIGWMVSDGGRVDGREVVPARWIDDILTGGDREAWASGEWGKAFGAIGRDMSYRAGWYVTGARPSSMFAMGIHGQNLFIDQQTRVVIAKVSSQHNPIDYQAMGVIHAAVPVLRELALKA